MLFHAEIVLLRREMENEQKRKEDLLRLTAASSFDEKKMDSLLENVEEDLQKMMDEEQRKMVDKVELKLIAILDDIEDENDGESKLDHQSSVEEVAVAVTRSAFEDRDSVKVFKAYLFMISIRC